MSQFGVPSDTTTPHTSGFSQPAHRPASSVESGDWPRPRASYTTASQYVPRGSQPNEKSEISSDDSINKHVASTDEPDNDILENSSVSLIREKESNPHDETREPNKTYVIDKSIVFNYSTMVINEPMQRPINIGLNFSILPPKLDITQPLAEFKVYERSIRWH